MKNLLTTFALCVTLMSYTQTPITKTVGEFSTFKAYDLINVEMIKSSENKVEISGKNAEDVNVVNKNGKLKIKLNLSESFDGNKTDVKLYYTSVDIIDANEGAHITSDDTIKQYEIELNAQEGGIIELDLEVSVAEIKAVTGGIIEPTGTAHNQNLKISTGGIYNGKSLKTTTSKLRINAGGEVHVNASELVDVKIRAGGDVFIYGNPNTVNESRALGGRIKRMD